MDIIRDNNINMGNYSFSAITESVDSLIYYPPQTPDEIFNKLDTNRSKMELLVTDNHQTVPIVIVMPTENQIVSKYIIFSHGNGCDIYGMFDYFKELADGCNACVIGYDYIGYGLSRINTPTETGCYESIDFVVKYVMNILEIKPENIYLFGQSLGTGVVVDYVTKNKWKN